LCPHRYNPFGIATAYPALLQINYLEPVLSSKVGMLDDLRSLSVLFTLARLSLVTALSASRF
jgi:hypothetical protein